MSRFVVRFLLATSLWIFPVRYSLLKILLCKTMAASSLSTVSIFFEALAFSCTTAIVPLTVLFLYRPASLLTSEFSELTALLDVFATFNSQLFITVDLNIHLESSTIPTTARFLDILSQFRLLQPSHILIFIWNSYYRWLAWSLHVMTMGLLTSESSVPPFP